MPYYSLKVESCSSNFTSPLVWDCGCAIKPLQKPVKLVKAQSATSSLIKLLILNLLVVLY